jgi:dTDP-4-dehydrorhamnose reductase
MAAILVTGSNGQLGSELQQCSLKFGQHHFYFTTRKEMAMEDENAINVFFEKNKIDYCINCAAYTAVDKAETEQDKAFAVNAYAVENLAKACKRFNAKLIHISTDYVFNGMSAIPYTETDTTDPVNLYGASKLKGEQLATDILPNVVIIRTSWVYSTYGNNFVKTMIRLMSERDNLNVVDDQVGAPTYAADLAQVIIQIINLCEDGDKWQPGIYHYSNEATISWFDFAVEIGHQLKSNCKVNPIPTTSFSTPAKRPSYSLLNTGKIKKVFNISTPEWKESLNVCIAILQKTIV